MVNEFVYCPRLFYYEWVEGAFVHSADTIDGAHKHKRVDKQADALPPPDDEAPVAARSVTLSSEAHHVIAKIDLVEGDGTTVTPVDYKKGAPREGDEGPDAWPADRVQVGVQALVLQESGYTCREAVLYYAKTKQRVRVPVDADLLAETLAAIRNAKATAEGGVVPPPLIDSPKCPRCSLVGICLPDETAFVEARRTFDDETAQLWLIEPEARPEAEEPPVRKLVPARDDLRPLYVAGQGMSVGKSGDVLRVKNRDRKVVQDARLFETSQVNLFGNVSVTTPALQALCAAEKPIAYFSGGGWFYGMTQGLGLRNAFLRAEQFRLAAEPTFCRRVASVIVGAKIRNQRTFLNRNHVEPPRQALVRMKALADAAARASALDELLGIEGMAARIYFQHFAGLIKVDDEALSTFSFEHRNRRPPRDAVNALLSLAYSLLAKDLTIVAASVGFDPFWGFYHQPRYGRPALALDLMEMFRPLVADSAVISAINTGMVEPKDFVRVGASVSMQPSGRKGLLRAYEQRLDALVTHPVFDYRVSYRRVFEIQARLLARFITGEIHEWPTFETR
ncbi:MAG: CRISPR-associated endonuclease Cas1 [Acidobacteria bacterium]|nr:CRISPR-associated endonuclease Cas1 [Acidobacteriota bacterium]